MTATTVSSAGNAALSVSDRGTVSPGYLVNGTTPLTLPLEVRANAGAFAPVGGANAPTNLVNYPGPVFTDVANVEFKQTIPTGEPLRTGRYQKQVTFTLSTTQP